ncbi:MAG: ABC transporter permease [Candidatus Thermoplasmatota archaeon]|nr:ABC transporter permease [Candidatus Thermoplasmatota archaeon]
MLVNNDPDEQFRPARKLFSESGILHEIWSNGKARFGMIVFIIFAIIGIFGHFIYPYSPKATFVIWQPPTFAHVFGTDYEGHDVLSQFLYGTGVSLYVGASVALISVAIGTMVGMLSGYYGGIVDNIFMRFVDILLIMPTFPLLVILAAYLPPTNNTTILILSLLSWPFMSRVIRSQVLTLKERPFIKAAVISGMKGFTIIRKEILDHLMPLIIINAVYLLVGAIVAQAGLAFFGLGDLTSINWGTMLYYAQSEDAIVYAAWWWILPPGIAIAIIGIGANIFGNGITEIFGKRSGGA